MGTGHAQCALASLNFNFSIVEVIVVVVRRHIGLMVIDNFVVVVVAVDAITTGIISVSALLDTPQRRGGWSENCFWSETFNESLIVARHNIRIDKNLLVRLKKYGVDGCNETWRVISLEEVRFRFYGKSLKSVHVMLHVRVVLPVEVALQEVVRIEEGQRKRGTFLLFNGGTGFERRRFGSWISGAEIV